MALPLSQLGFESTILAGGFGNTNFKPKVSGVVLGT